LNNARIHTLGAATNFVDSLNDGLPNASACVQSKTRDKGTGQNEVLGYFVAMKGFEEVHLLNITVAPEFQGRGWGKAMLEALAVWSRGQGANDLWLEVRASNARAIHVYQAHGFETVSVRKDYYPDRNSAREDAVVMKLKL
jgi:ribosomal-protein-alanine N-acetyltransferase